MLALLAVEEIALNTTHIAAVLGWLTMVILAMGGFIAAIFKRNLDQQDRDRAALSENGVRINRALDAIELRDEALKELVRKIDEQNRAVLARLDEALDECVGGGSDRAPRGRSSAHRKE